jgi:hypothetical protein
MVNCPECGMPLKKSHPTKSKYSCENSACFVIFAGAQYLRNERGNWFPRIASACAHNVPCYSRPLKSSTCCEKPVSV